MFNQKNLIVAAGVSVLSLAGFGLLNASYQDGFFEPAVAQGNGSSDVVDDGEIPLLPVGEVYRPGTELKESRPVIDGKEISLEEELRLIREDPHYKDWEENYVEGIEDTFPEEENMTREDAIYSFAMGARAMDFNEKIHEKYSDMTSASWIEDNRFIHYAATDEAALEEAKKIYPLVHTHLFKYSYNQLHDYMMTIADLSNKVPQPELPDKGPYVEVAWKAIQPRVQKNVVELIFETGEGNDSLELVPLQEFEPRTEYEKNLVEEIKASSIPEDVVRISTTESLDVTLDVGFVADEGEEVE